MNLKSLLLLSFLLVPSFALAVPLQIPYSGQLSESGTLVNGTRAMTFVIYDAASGGSALYTQAEPTVSVMNGVYHVELNAPDTVWNGSDRWLGVSVNGGPELTPRTKIGSVPFAVRAGALDNLPTVPADPFPGSTILTPDQKFQLNIWTGSVFRTWTLCYRKSQHGSSSATFHLLCDRRGPTVTIIKLSNGKIMGGYTGYPWSTDLSFHVDDTAFLFSLTAGRTYGLGNTNRQYSVRHGDAGDYGPTFGYGHDIWVNGSMDIGYCNFPNSYLCNGQEAAPNDPCRSELCGTTGIAGVAISELEVWVKQ